MTLLETITVFLNHCQYEKRLSEKTVYAYSTDLNQFYKFIKDNEFPIELSTINKDVIKQYLQSIASFKPKTAKRKVASLKAMFNFIEYEHDDFINPFRKLKVRLKEPLILPKAMTITEVQSILRNLYSEVKNLQNKNLYTYKSKVRDLAIIELLFATGMRVSELTDLRLMDVGFDNKQIKIYGKGSKERIIQICQAETLQSLANYCNLFANHIHSTGYFFINRLGSKLSSQSVRLMVKKYAKKAGIKQHITPHVSRHRILSFGLKTSGLQE